MDPHLNCCRWELCAKHYNNFHNSLKIFKRKLPRFASNVRPQIKILSLRNYLDQIKTSEQTSNVFTLFMCGVTDILVSKASGKFDKFWAKLFLLMLFKILWCINLRYGLKQSNCKLRCRQHTDGKSKLLIDSIGISIKVGFDMDYITQVGVFVLEWIWRDFHRINLNGQ